jgi:LmbE family N-acetylglucosaminyl deacetylase
VSPHLDDAVFSAGGLMARMADAGWDVVVLTVFTGSVSNPCGFALACQLDKGLGADVDYMALRREEDLRACGLLGVRAVWLPFLEAPHRGYGSARALFGDVLAGDDVAGAVAEAVGAWDADVVMAPQAVGGHVDHVQVVRAMARVRPAVTVWWRDFPYLARAAAAEPFRGRFEGLADAAVEVDLGRKLGACAAYRSQIGFQFGGEAGLRERLGETGGVERFRVEGDVRLP